MNKRILGLDLGSKTLGVSVSDPMGLFAQPVKTIRFEEDDYGDAITLLYPLIEEFGVHTVVLGLPKHMNGDMGIRANISVAFKDELIKKDIDVILWDERLTTMAAQRILIEADVSRKKRKQIIDQMAAVQILQGYLDSRSVDKKFI